MKIKNKMIDGGLSFLLPGVGQIRQGETVKGVAQLAATAAVVTVAGPVGAVALTALAAYSTVDAIGRRAEMDADERDEPVTIDTTAIRRNLTKKFCGNETS